jgi:hypothetical protein
MSSSFNKMESVVSLFSIVRNLANRLGILNCSFFTLIRSDSAARSNPFMVLKDVILLYSLYNECIKIRTWKNGKYDLDRQILDCLQ